MTHDIFGDCPSCGASSSAKHRVFVEYEPRPNTIQEELGRCDDLPSLTVILCTECDHLIAVALTGSGTDVPEDGSSSEYRIGDDEVLE